jgi:hypothetical protein
VRPSLAARSTSTADVATSAPAAAAARRIASSWRRSSAYASPGRKSGCARNPVTGSGRSTAKSDTVARHTAVMPAARATRTASATDAAPSAATIGCPADSPARKHRPA